ncbi:2148_t:CDS:10, partial [Acaulospora colombiana]
MKVYYPSGPLIDYVPQILCEPGTYKTTKEDLRRGLSVRDINTLTRILKNCYVTINSRANGKKRKIRILSISSESSNNLYIGNNQFTVSQHYKDKLGTPLQYPMLPCVVANNLWTDNAYYYPMEMCEIISGQKYPTNNLSCQQRTDYREDEVLRSIGMELDDKFIELTSRVLKAPQLVAQEGDRITPEAGCWEIKKFSKASILANWSVVSFENPRYLREAEIINALKLLIREMLAKGINVQGHPPIHFANPQGNSLMIGVKNIIGSTSKSPPFVICIIHTARNELYRDIKKCCATELGIISQCIVGSNMRHGRRWEIICSNLALKINGKLGGTNSALAPPEMRFFEKDSKDKFMFFVCASINPEATRYAARYRTIFSPNNEIIDQISPMVIDLIKLYKENNNDFPDQIVFYRDGMAGGQIESIIRTEILPTEDELKKLYGSRRPPKFTFVCSVNYKDSDPRGGNCKPGT